MHRLAGPMAERSRRVKREVMILVALVLLVDGLFVVGYFAAGLVRASDVMKMGYTAVWTVITMVVVLRGLTRIRALRSGTGR